MTDDKGHIIPRSDKLQRLCFRCGTLTCNEYEGKPTCAKCIEQIVSTKKSEVDTYEPELDGVRNHNVGESDYSKHKIQPWDIWIEYKLNPFDADIVKRVLRHKKTDSRKMDYQKIIHICQERIRQIDSGTDVWEEK